MKDMVGADGSSRHGRSYVGCMSQRWGRRQGRRGSNGPGKPRRVPRSFACVGKLVAGARQACDPLTVDPYRSITHEQFCTWREFDHLATPDLSASRIQGVQSAFQGVGG